MAKYHFILACRRDDTAHCDSQTWLPYPWLPYPILARFAKHECWKYLLAGCWCAVQAESCALVGNFRKVMRVLFWILSAAHMNMTWTVSWVQKAGKKEAESWMHRSFCCVVGTLIHIFGYHFTIILQHVTEIQCSQHENLCIISIKWHDKLSPGNWIFLFFF